MSDLRNINLDGMSVEQLQAVKNILLDALMEGLANKTVPAAKLPDEVKRQLATHTVQPQAVNWNEVPELNAADVLAEAEAILAGCCPACGSSRVQSSTMDGRTIYDCLDCDHSWEG